MKLMENHKIQAFLDRLATGCWWLLVVAGSHYVKISQKTFTGLHQFWACQCKDKIS